MPGSPPLLPVPRKARVGTDRVPDGPARVSVDRGAGLPAQGYRLSTSSDGVAVVAADPAGAFYATKTLAQLRDLAPLDHPHTLPVCEIEDWPALPTRGVMLDVSRDKVPTVDTLEALIDRLSSWKINHVQLYMEHTFAYEGHEVVWEGADPYSSDDLQRLDAFCRARHVELSANQNTLGHMERWLRHPRYRALAIDEAGFDLGGRRLPPMTMDPAKPGALALARELLAMLVPNVVSPRVHVGLDEPWELPDDRYPDYLAYVAALRESPELDGREMLVWGDILAKHPDSVRGLPEGVTICDWGYETTHPTVARGPALASSGHAFWVCPGTSSWNSILGRGGVARSNICSAATSGVEHGAQALLVTDWGDNGHVQYLPISEPWFAYAAATAWCPERNAGIDLPEAVDAHVLCDTAGRLGRALLSLADLHRSVEQPWLNGSAITANLYSPRLRIGEGRTERVTDAGLSAAADGLREAQALVESSSPSRGDGALLRDELLNAVRLVDVLVSDQQSRLAAGGRIEAVDREVRRGLAARLDDVTDEHRRLWLARNRAGGLTDSLSRLERLREVYLA